MKLTPRSSNDVPSGRRPSRRCLLRNAAAAAASLGLASVPLAARGRRAARLGTAIAPGLIAAPDAALERNVLSLLDLDRADAEQRLIDMSFYGHGIASDPLDPNRIAVFEKGGSGACMIDLESGSVVRPILTSEDRDFYGHGAFSPDGELLYATERLVADNYRGVIVVRDGKSLVQLGEFPSYGTAPHDCVLRDGGETMVITNGGGPARGPESEFDRPCVTYVDVKSRELIERVDIENPDIGAGHLALTKRGDLAVASAARGGKVREGVGAASLRPLGGDLHTLDRPTEITARMRGETLSVAIHEPSGVVGMTNPFGGLVTFWNLKTASFVRALDLSYPRGIAVSLDGSSFVISYGRSAALLEVSTDDLEPIRGSRRGPVEMHGSHLVLHDR